MRLTIKTKLAATFVVIVALSGASMFIALQNLGQLNDTLERIVIPGQEEVQDAIKAVAYR